MRVLHVYRTYFPDPPGGLQEAIRQIALATRPLGVESRIFTLSPQPQPPVIERPEGRVIRTRSWAAPASCDLGGYAALRAFRAQVAWADVVHYYFPWPFADLLHWLAPVRKPAVMTYVSDIVRQRWLARAYAPLMRRTLQAMQAIVAVAPAYARTSAVLAAPWCRQRLQTIPLGIVEESYRDALAAAADVDLARLLGRAQGIGQAPGDRAAPSAGGYLLALGALRYYKGLHVLIDAAASTGLPVVIAGDGPQRDALVRRARQRKAPVTFLGRVNDAEKMALLKGCRALVLPSHLRSEAFGMVLVEAAMMARPMISCEIGTGTSYVNLHEQTGLVIPPSDVAALADAMRRLTNDTALCKRYGARARQRYETLFAGTPLGQAYGDLYGSALSHRQGD